MGGDPVGKEREGNRENDMEACFTRLGGPYILKDGGKLQLRESSELKAGENDVMSNATANPG